MIWLSELARNPSRDGGAFGGKAEGLARLVAAAASVPRGFAVRPTTEPPDAWSDRDREAFLAMGRELLAQGPVSVRSSARGEDSDERSYAGLFETVLGVRTEDELLAAAERCVASGASERVASYAAAAATKEPTPRCPGGAGGGAPPPKCEGEAIPVGLVVQAMVDARAAGVCFTVDPAGCDHAIVIEAVPGLGDALVSGRAQPEAWRVYRSGLGGFEAHGKGTVLSAKEAQRVGEEAAALAGRLGEPLDLEWALDRDGALLWLQARPVTAAVKAPEPWIVERACPEADDGPVTVWLNWNVKETLPQPLPPLSWDFWREQVLPILNEQIFGVPTGSPLARQLHALDLVHGRIYANLNAALGFPLAGPVLRHLLRTVDERGGAEVDALLGAGVLRPRRLRGSFGVSLRMAWASLTTLSRFSRGFFPRRCLETLHRAGTAIHRRPHVSTLANGELLEELRLWQRPPGRPLLDGLQMEGLAMLVYSAAARAFRGHARALSLLTTGIPANPTTQISLGIEELVEIAGRSPGVSALLLQPLDARTARARLRGEPSAAPFEEALERFLDANGHRGPMEFDIASTRWSEDPSMILDLVRAGLRSQAKESLSQRLSRLAVERSEGLEAAYLAAPFWKRPLLRILARLVELYMPLREAPKHYGIFVFARVRDAVRELGRRLAAGGLLESADDVFFLERAELEALAAPEKGIGTPREELAARVRARRERYARYLAEKPPDLVRSDGVPAQVAEPDVPSDGLLRGAPVSAGVGRGAVRVLATPDASAISDGDVLVMELADPGWTPLFPRAAAVVMEVGGLMCHAAVVAREMGIPAVFAVKGATRLLRTGELVVVDGTAGTIQRIAS